MILTVTINSSIDKVLFIDEWTPGLPMRTERVITSVGGKGLDASVVLRHMGVDTVGISFVAGKTGQELIDLVETYGITADPIWVGGETRTAHVIVETKNHRHNHVTSGRLVVTGEDVDRFLEQFRTRVKDAAWVICSGSVPAGVPTDIYGRLAAIGHEYGIPSIVDSTGAYILDSLPYHPDIIKMNWAEFEQTFQVNAETLEALEERGRSVYVEHGLRMLVITCGEEGILAFHPEGVYLARAPEQASVNAAGAGDAVSAALAWRFSLGESCEQALKWAAAMSAASVLTEGTADLRVEDVERILPMVEVRSRP